MPRLPNFFRSIEIFHLVTLVYAILTVVFAYERIMHTDCSYQLFHSVNDRAFFFQENRFGVFPTQLLMLAGIWAELPMHVLVHLYSIGFPLVYIAIMLVNQFVFRSREAAMATILGLVIGTRETFFHCTTETHLLLAVSCLLFGAFHARGNSQNVLGSYFLWGVILIWGFFIHPNALFTFFFVAGLAFLQKKISLKESISVVVACLAFVLLKMALTPEGSYDSRQYEQLFAWKENLPRFFDLPAIWFIHGKPTNEYIVLPIIAIILLVAYRRPLELLFTAFCVAGFMVITILTFPNGESLVMMEKSFMPAGFMIVFLLCMLHYRSSRKWITAICIAGLSAFSFVHFHQAGSLFTARLDGLTSIMKEVGPEHPKTIVHPDHYGNELLRNNHWATSLDALLLSQSLNMGPRTIFITEDPESMIKDTIDPDLFLYLPWDPYGMELKNKEYFDLPQVPYIIMEPRKKITTE